MLDGRYGQATNNIAPQDVASVEVMENHQPIKALKDIVFSDRAAINLRLKPHAKARWTGTLRGGAGASRIVIGVAELDEFDDTRVCEVTLKMGGQSKVIATITRGTLERGFSLRTCKIDEYGDFEYGDSETGLTYSYNEGEAQSIDLTWPEGRTDFSMPILVEANYEWAINRMPE